MSHEICGHIYSEQDMRNVVYAAASYFDTFQDGAKVTVEGVRKIAREYTQMQMDPGPQEITFTDGDGNERKIVYAAGDPNVGIFGGWIITQ